MSLCHPIRCPIYLYSFWVKNSHLYLLNGTNISIHTIILELNQVFYSIPSYRSTFRYLLKNTLKKYDENKFIPILIVKIGLRSFLLTVGKKGFSVDNNIRLGFHFIIILDKYFI